MARWKPIDTAPKDGSYVLLYLPPCVGFMGPVEEQYAVAMWEGGAWVRGPGAAWTHDGTVRVGGVWQPLPKPPSAAT